MNQTTTTPDRATILAMVDRWISQRPGLDFANYGSASSYRSESRSITQDGKIARQLWRYIELRDSITAERIAAAFPRAFSGRLQLTESSSKPGRWELTYCTGQYFPTEYRKAAAAVAASIVWDYWRESMPAPDAFIVKCLGEDGAGGYVEATSKRFTTRADADRYASTVAGSRHPMVWDLYSGKSAGDYLRAKARAEFGRTIADRHFR